MEITYYGHSAYGIEAAGKRLIIDPFISANPKAAQIDVDSLRADYVLLTHAHYDHIIDVERIIDRTKAKLVANHEIITWYQANKQYEGHAMNQGGSWEFDFGTLKAVSAVHSSSFPDGTYGGNPLGFVLSSEGKTIYIAGDTALTWDMKIIPLFKKLDLAILPIGGNFTMDVGEAVIAADFIQCDKIMGVHYDTMEIISVNHEDAKKKFKEKGKELVLLNVGESLGV